MTHDITLLPEKHICIITFHEGWHTAEGVERRATDIKHVLQEAQSPVFFIMNLSEVKMTVEGVVRSANRFARGPDALFHHPMCRGVALVTTERIAQMVARGLQTETFGGLRVQVCASVREAIDKSGQ